jgi:hypothetical protein
MGASMKVVCAWCKQEGRNSLLGECEPFEDKTESHGICARHSQTLLEQLPSVSFPGTRVLIVVQRNDMDLYNHLVRSFASVRDVAVILDRRETERRKLPGEASVDQRRSSRRIRSAEFSNLGYYVVRFGPERERPSAAEPLRKFPALVRRIAK